MSCGQRSAILAQGLTPEEAMLRGPNNEANCWLVSFTADDLVGINAKLGTQLHFVLDKDDPKFVPDPSNPTDPWHGNVYDLPADDSDKLEDVQIELARRAAWVKPPHGDLLNDWFSGALDRANKARGQNKVNELKNLLGMLDHPEFPDAATRRASVEGMLKEAIAVLPRRVRCKACGKEFNEDYAKAQSACPNPKCKASPFTFEPVAADGSST